MIVKPHKESSLIYQTGNDDMPVPEPAILIESYSDAFCISQDGSNIMVNYETIPDLIKVLREIKTKKP